MFPHLLGDAPQHRKAHWQPPPNSRGSFEILSTCLITLGLCIWTAVHLNIPERYQRAKYKKSDPRYWVLPQTIRKVGWLVMGMRAPEMVGPIPYVFPISRQHA